MKMGKLSGILLGMLMAAAVACAQGAQDVATMSEVLGLEQTWVKSQQTNDVELLKPLLADNIVDTSPEGKLIIGKEAVVADAKAIRWSTAEYTEMRIAVFADAAVATAVFTGQGTDRGGKAVKVHERFTDTWIKAADGSWRCVASHGSTIRN